LPFLRAEVVEIETFVEIKNICGGIKTSVQRNPAKKDNIACYFSLIAITRLKIENKFEFLMIKLIFFKNQFYHQKFK